MNAGRILRDAGYDSRALRAWIAPVDPDDINVWPAAAMFRRLWRTGIKGVTHWKWVFVDPEVMRGDRKRLARLVIHELVHVRQYLELGYLGFTARYVRDYLRGRIGGKDKHQSYLDIAAETEAREITESTLKLM
jgi:hypothetical protein